MKDILINIKLVSESDEVSPLSRSLAQTIINKDYLTIGNWMKSLSNDEIEYLNDIINIGDTDELFQEASSEIVLLTLLLVYSEGVYPETIEEVSMHTGIFKMIVAGTDMDRKGITKACYENMSFGEGLGNEYNPFFKAIL